MLSPRELARHAVIVREPGSGTRAVVGNACASIRLQIQAAMSVSDTEAIRRMLIAQHSIACISSLSVKEELRRGELVLLAVHGLRIE
jgi:DNA-binding transcriptional LysR family regulator